VRQILFIWHKITVASKWPTFTFLRIPSQITTVGYSYLRLCVVYHNVVTSRRCDKERDTGIYDAVIVHSEGKLTSHNLLEVAVSILMKWRLTSWL
jgi:hypothetical protein